MVSAECEPKTGYKPLIKLNLIALFGPNFEEYCISLFV